MVRKFRVAEIFGPTIQGEGRQIGIPAYFIRFGGCDYRCTWCDSPHAVLPHLVSQLPQMTPEEIVKALVALPQGPRWVVFSGGNPGLLDLDDLISRLLAVGFRTMLETQGSVWRDWFYRIDDLCISPKPPSSKMILDTLTLARIVGKLAGHENKPYFKMPIFDDLDYEYAKNMHAMYPELEFFLSVGNDDPSLPTVGNPGPEILDPETVFKGASLASTQEIVLRKMKWLMEKVAGDKEMKDVRVLPQMHVLAWGNQRGR